MSLQVVANVLRGSYIDALVVCAQEADAIVDSIGLVHGPQFLKPQSKCRELALLCFNLKYQ